MKRKMRQKAIWRAARYTGVLWGLVICFFCVSCGVAETGTEIHTSATEEQAASGMDMIAEETIPQNTATEPKETVAEPTVPEETEQAPAAVPDDWRLTLVNYAHPITQEWQMSLTELPNGMLIDERCYEDLMEMVRACATEGGKPLICSAYRTPEKQAQLFEEKVQKLCDEGWEPDAARAEAATVVAVPGTSEHHIGLAVDIVDARYQCLDTDQECTETQKWLLEHCWEYGFILRYPNGKSQITGIIYEPWHYRYVGREAALEIRDSGLCFEEYLAQFGVT